MDHCKTSYGNRWRPAALAGLRRLFRDRRGQMGLVFGLTAVTVLTAIGSGIDLGRAYLARQQLSSTANLTCQYANRDSVAQIAFGPNGTSAYQSKVNTFVTSTIGDQKLHYPQTNATPFTYNAGGSGTVSLTASVPTTFMAMAGVTSVPVTSTMQCFTQIGTVTEPVAVAGSQFLVQEGFENAASSPYGFNWYTANGTIISPYVGPTYNVPYSGTFPPNAGYAGTNGNQWFIMGYCAEIDQVGTIESTVPEGTHSLELDCDNGQGTKGNSSISTKLYMQAGSYEFRWNYVSRIVNYDYQSSYICGNSSSDTSWANDPNYQNGFGNRTNQINIYFDKNPASGIPPTHTTLDGTETLAGSNLIDTCVYSPYWIQRSVRITVSAAGYYWLSLAADGANDSYGGQVDNLQFCKNTCPGTVQDNYPTNWLPANNGGNNLVLFEDTFESPPYVTNTAYYTSTLGNLGLSFGSSTVWDELGQGWATAPLNQVNYGVKGAQQGSQYVEVVGKPPNGATTSARMFSRSFLLVPGYYNLSYYYISQFYFPSIGTYTYCGANPSAANLSTNYGSATGNMLYSSTQLTEPYAINAIGVFMSNAQLVSTPNGGGLINSTTSYTNPDGNTADTPPITTTSTTPTVAPDAISLTNYTASTTSALLDMCGFSSPWVKRSVNFQITKTGNYWLTFSSQMAPATISGAGGAIDDVKLTALGSPYMLSAPSNPVVVPVPNPQPGSTVAFTGFTILADMLQP